MKLNEVKQTLHHIYTINNKLEEGNQSFTISPILIGDPGIGKTSIVREFAQEKGIQVVTLRLSQLDDPSQLLGYPYKLYPVRNKYIKDTEGEIVLIPENQLVESSDIVGTPVTKYAAPDFVSKLKEGDILLIDDYNRQIPFFNNAVMEIIYEKGNISWKLPKGCMVILTGNPEDEDYQVNTLDDAQKRRLLYINVDFDIKNWAKYCNSQGISHKYVNFIMSNTLFFKTKKNQEGFPPSKLTELGLILKYSDNDINKCLNLVKLYLGDKYNLLVKEFSAKDVYYDFEPYFIDEETIDDVMYSITKLTDKELYNSYKELEYYLVKNIKDNEEIYSKKLIKLYETNIIPKDCFFAIINELVKLNESTTLFFADYLIELNNL